MDRFFSAYEVKLIRSGLSPMEVTPALISMQAELEEAPSERTISRETYTKIHMTCDAHGNPIEPSKDLHVVQRIVEALN